MSGFTFKEAKRRYKVFFWPVMVGYIAVCIGGALIQRMMPEAPIWLAPLLAVVTISPIFAVFYLMWRYTQETDEFSRLLQLEAFTIGGMVTASAIGLVGFLQLYDVIGSVQVFWFLPLFFVSYGIAHKFRGAKECV